MCCTHNLLTKLNLNKYFKIQTKILYRSRYLIINLAVIINFTVLSKIYPLITAIGLNLTVFLLIPAAWQVFTTSVTFLYDSGASSITNFGDATLIEIPIDSSLVKTSL